jgi:hypothetical protein
LFALPRRSAINQAPSRFVSTICPTWTFNQLWTTPAIQGHKPQLFKRLPVMATDQDQDQDQDQD